MPVNHDFKSEYKNIIEQLIKGSVLIKVKAKRLYNLFSSWLHGETFTQFEELSLHEQKAWILTAYKIPYDDYDDDDEI